MLIFSVFFYFAIWYILSSSNDSLMVTCGIVISIIMALLVARDTSRSKIKLLRFIKYSSWLLKEIIISSFRTILFIITGKISPSFERVEISNISELGHTIFDNSITLTPGTLCISDSSNNVIIHALHQDFLHDIHSGILENKVREIITK